MESEWFAEKQKAMSPPSRVALLISRSAGGFAELGGIFVELAASRGRAVNAIIGSRGTGTVPTWERCPC